MQSNNQKCGFRCSMCNKQLPQKIYMYSRTTSPYCRCLKPIHQNTVSQLALYTNPTVFSDTTPNIIGLESSKSLTWAYHKKQTQVNYHSQTQLSKDERDFIEANHCEGKIVLDDDFNVLPTSSNVVSALENPEAKSPGKHINEHSDQKPRKSILKNKNQSTNPKVIRSIFKKKVQFQLNENEQGNNEQSRVQLNKRQSSQPDLKKKSSRIY